MVGLVVGLCQCVCWSVGLGWRKMDEAGTENASIHTVILLLYAEVTRDDEAAAGVGGTDCYPPK